MDLEPAGVFVVTMQAVAGPRNSQPDGLRYDLLVFARGDSEAAAEQTAFAGLAQLGWVDAVALRTGEITDPAAVPEDLQPALARARQSGCAVIVYEQP
ncbi:hypothetical protein DJ021_02425 [Phenylobacterium hankyongense]|uniref:Uncharacterized protein n=1 Tax=Phenylobacterium hankyongense TaxID=1813876 RepID=A0A328AVW9_9CAUL|nr:hypothetical protein [Phenylobacterium hankyongense]RAK58737.1 hypothetical protein DJ021_02425 [Phenylobacterium hankyongense]